MLQRGKKPAPPAPPVKNGKYAVVMVSSYLDRPLRTLEQVLDDRASRRTPTQADRYADSHASGPDSVELPARSPAENIDQDGAPEATADQRPRRRRPRAA
jgi:hypothetical protein